MKNLKNLIALTAVTVMVASFAQAADAPKVADAPKPPQWVTTANVGLTLTSGNTETVLITGDLNTAKKGERNEYLLGISGAYGENQGDKNNEIIRAFGQWNHLFSDRAYGYARLEGLHDGIAEVRYRITASPGAGYYFIKEEKTRLSLEVGPGYVYEKLASGLNHFFTVRISERFEQKLSKTARLWQTAEWLPNTKDLNDYIVNAEIGIESAITEKLKLRALLQDTYDSTPSTGRKNNDLKLIAGLGYTF